MKKRFLPFINMVFVHSVGTPVCTDETLPSTDFDFCDPEVKSSEIQRIFVRKVSSTNFADWTQAEEWNERVSETSTDADAIRALTVIGDKPLPTTTSITISGGRKFNTVKEHIINFEIDEVTATNHEFTQAIGNGKRYKVNYETAGGLMFGGNNGIVAEMTLEMQLNRGAGEVQKYIGTLTWKTPDTEARCTSPIFGETVLGSATLDTTVTFAADATPAVGSCDFDLAGGTNAVANFQYNDINPTIGTAIAMTIKVGGVLKLTCNMTADFVGQPFIFKATTGTEYSGFIADGDVLF